MSHVINEMYTDRFRGSHLMARITPARHTITTQLHSLSHSILSFTPDLQAHSIRNERSDTESGRSRIFQKWYISSLPMELRYLLEGA
jgi:hypothetical protein